MTAMSAPAYKTIRAIARKEQVTDLAIWQVIRSKIVKSRVLHGDVVVDADEWDAYASSYAGKRYLKERRRNISGEIHDNPELLKTE